MNRLLAGLMTTAIVAALVLAGFWALVDTYIVTSSTTYLMPTIGVGVVAFGFVFALFALGARSDSWISSPYW